MAVAFNSVAGTYSNDNPASSTPSTTFTFPTGLSNPGLIVGMSWVQSSTSLSSATYNGTTVTILGQSGGTGNTALLYLASPDEGSAHTFAMTFSTSLNDVLRVKFLSFSGCKQTGAMMNEYNSENLNSANTSNFNMTATTDDMGVDVFQSSPGTSMAADADQTERGTDLPGGADSQGMSTDPGATTVTMGWSHTADNYSYSTGIVLAEPPAGGVFVHPLVKRRWSYR